MSDSSEKATGEDSGETRTPRDVEQRQKPGDQSETVGESFPAAPKQVREMMASVMQYSGPLPNPIAKQVTPEHIDKLLENNQQEMVLEHSKEMRKLTLSFFTVILLVGFLVFCIVFLKDDSELRKLLITGILSLVTGLAGGYGLGRSSAKP